MIYSAKHFIFEKLQDITVRQGIGINCHLYKLPSKLNLGSCIQKFLQYGQGLSYRNCPKVCEDHENRNPHSFLLLIQCVCIYLERQVSIKFYMLVKKNDSLLLGFFGFVCVCGGLLKGTTHIKWLIASKIPISTFFLF